MLSRWQLLSDSASSFPANVQPFSVFALLTDGLGDGIIRLGVLRLETD